jgi:hypothetical protein
LLLISALVYISIPYQIRLAGRKEKKRKEEKKKREEKRK